MADEWRKWIGEKMESLSPIKENINNAVSAVVNEQGLIPHAVGSPIKDVRNTVMGVDPNAYTPSPTLPNPMTTPPSPVNPASFTQPVVKPVSQAVPVMSPLAPPTTIPGAYQGDLRMRDLGTPLTPASVSPALSPANTVANPNEQRYYSNLGIWSSPKEQDAIQRNKVMTDAVAPAMQMYKQGQELLASGGSINRAQTMMENARGLYSSTMDTMSKMYGTDVGAEMHKDVANINAAGIKAVAETPERTTPAQEAMRLAEAYYKNTVAASGKQDKAGADIFSLALKSSMTTNPDTLQTEPNIPLAIKMSNQIGKAMNPNHKDIPEVPMSWDDAIEGLTMGLTPQKRMSKEQAASFIKKQWPFLRQPLDEKGKK